MQEKFAKEFAERNAIVRDNLKGSGGMVQQKSVKTQKKMGIMDAEREERMTGGSTSESSGVSGPTIGTTTIASSEAAEIRDAVRSELRKMFPGIARFETESVHLNRGAEPGYSKSAVATVGSFSAQSRPEAIAGSEISVASTRSNNGPGENQNSLNQC